MGYYLWHTLADLLAGSLSGRSGRGLWPKSNPSLMSSFCLVSSSSKKPMALSLCRLLAAFSSLGRAKYLLTALPALSASCKLTQLSMLACLISYIHCLPARTRSLLDDCCCCKSVLTHVAPAGKHQPKAVCANELGHVHAFTTLPPGTCIKLGIQKLLWQPVSTTL